MYVYVIRAECRIWGQRGQTENFQNLGGGNGMRVSKQLGGFLQSRGSKINPRGDERPPLCSPGNLYRYS